MTGAILTIGGAVLVAYCVEAWMVGIQTRRIEALQERVEALEQLAKSRR